MQSFETKVIKANKILKNIRGYLLRKNDVKKINSEFKTKHPKKIFGKRSKKVKTILKKIL